MYIYVKWACDDAKHQGQGDVKDPVSMRGAA